MSKVYYHFVTSWQIDASIQEVYDIISDSDSLSRWWPTVYLEVHTLEAGNQDGLSKLVDLHTKGWLPYTLSWQFRVIRIKKPELICIEATGDFNGTGTWKFIPQSKGCEVVFDWTIYVSKPLITSLSWLLRPLFSWNHRWAMQEGERSLKKEILQRRLVKHASKEKRELNRLQLI